jgi:transcriptional regulator with XRE-family HTH domain
MADCLVWLVAVSGCGLGESFGVGWLAEDGAVAESPGGFAGVLREFRAAAGLTQEELAEAAGLSQRAVGDLERGAAARPQRETVRLLADALHLIGPERAQFEAVARGRPVAGGVTATRALPYDIASFTGRRRELEQLAAVAAGERGLQRPAFPIRTIPRPESPVGGGAEQRGCGSVVGRSIRVPQP